MGFIGFGRLHSKLCTDIDDLAARFKQRWDKCHDLRSFAGQEDNVRAFDEALGSDFFAGLVQCAAKLRQDFLDVSSGCMTRAEECYLRLRMAKDGLNEALTDHSGGAYDADFDHS